MPRRDCVNKSSVKSHHVDNFPLLGSRPGSTFHLKLFPWGPFFPFLPFLPIRYFGQNADPKVLDRLSCSIFTHNLQRASFLLVTKGGAGGALVIAFFCPELVPVLLPPTLLSSRLNGGKAPQPRGGCQQSGYELLP